MRNSGDYYKIVSDSMAPLIEVGDMIIIESIKKNGLKKGNILLFNDNGKKVVHRVVKITKNNVFLKGDNGFNIQKISKFDVEGIALKIFFKQKIIEIGSFKENVFVLFDRILFQRIIFLRTFNYRVFRYNNMKRIKKWLW